MYKIAKKRGIGADVMSDGDRHPESYWRREQDLCVDVSRIMKRRSLAATTDRDPVLHEYATRNGYVEPLISPNVCITAAPAEWTFPRPYFMHWRGVG